MALLENGSVVRRKGCLIDIVWVVELSRFS